MVAKAYVYFANYDWKWKRNRVFVLFTGTLTGARLLDIGTGPTIHTVISASRHVTEIHLSDFADQNRKVLRKWLDGTPMFKSVFEYILKKENDGTSLDARIEMVRDKVKKIYAVDLLQAKPIEELDTKYDIITSSACLEVVAKTKQDYGDILAKVADMLNPGGYIVMTGSLNVSFYKVGDFRFDNLKISGYDLKRIYADKGFHIKVWREMRQENDKQPEEYTERSDYDGVFAAVVQKMA